MEINFIMNDKYDIFILTSKKDKYILEQHNYYKENYKIHVFNYHLELANYFSDNNVEKGCLLISDTDDISVEEIYLEISKEVSLFKIPILFKASSEKELLNLKKLSIPSVNITVSYSIDNTIDFITSRLYVYKNYLSEITNNDYFSGRLSELFGFINLIYLIHTNSKTGVLSLKIEESKLYFEIFFEKGNIVYAYENNGYFPLNGIDAIKDIFDFKDLNKVSYDFMSDINAPDRHFYESTELIIEKLLKNLSFNKAITKTSTLETNGFEDIRKDTFEHLKRGNIMTKVENFDKPVEISEDIFWVSERNKKSLLQLNSYLRVFRKGEQSINMLVDPGAIEFFPAISRKVGNVIGDISKINMYSINHQDPDVGMNSTFISRINPKSVCLCTEDTWRLVQFYEIPKNTYKNVYSFNEKKVTLATNSEHTIEFIPTPYCHFVGAFALYDKASRILFTGDLFGGLNPANNMDLWANEEHWEGVKIFHQIYMPSKKAIRNAIDNIRNMPVPPLMIVPQHGAILAGDIMDLFLNRLYNLDVGMDLFNKAPYSKLTPVYLEVMNMIYHKFLNYVGEEQAEYIFNFNDKKQELFYLADFDITGVKDIYSQHERALNLLITIISKSKETSIVNEIKSLAIKETLLRQLPIPVNMYQDAADLEGENNSELITEEKNIFGAKEDLFV